MKKRVHNIFHGKKDVHPYLPELYERFLNKEIDRRSFMSNAARLGAFVGASAVVAGCGGDGVSSAGDGKRGGTLRFALQLQELTDPALFNWIESSNVSRGLCEYLVEVDENNVSKPYLAESWKPSADLKTWDLTLRKGVKWSNGDDFEASDVIFNFDRWRVKDSKSINRTLWGNVTGVERVNSHQLKVHLSSPMLELPENLYQYTCAMVHPSFDDTGADLVKNPIGTGPYDLTHFQVGEGATLKRRDNYWGKPANLDGVQFVDLGEDPQAQVSALQSKQVDLVYKVGVEQLETVQGIPHAQLFDVVTAQTTVVRFQIDQKPYNNHLLRQAITAATDNSKILEIAYRGRGLVAENHHTCQIQPEYYDLPVKPTRDIEKARDLLRRSGYRGRNPLKLTVGNTQGNFEQNVCQIIKEQCDAAGIKIDLKVLPSAEYWKIWDKDKFSLTFWTHRPLAVMLHNLAYNSKAVWNETHFRNKKYDRALAKASSTPDPIERSKVMQKVQSLLQDNHIMIQPFWRRLYAAGDKRVKGFAAHPTQYYRMDRVWLDES